jgi:lipopolysaccharide transport system ATP-binding protein
MTSAISVDSISKRYRVDHAAPRGAAGYRTLREDLIGLAAAPWRNMRRFFGENGSSANGASTEDFWALKDVSFDIRPGEVVGIIGRNGAGKSTLLKILSRITPPTAGRVTLNGRVGSLLEVGTGFHPELTGRENIFMNGSILGMSRREIRHKFDEIVDFAEIERFLDTPVKRYSSGMYVRLAFAVAAHLEPEILIVDEVLAVGDSEFQRKCLGAMESIGKSGRTVIFVSHNLNAILRLTTSAILICAGTIRTAGDSRSVVTEYLNIGHQAAAVWRRPPQPVPQSATIQSIRSLNESGALASRFCANEPVVIELECFFRERTSAQLAFRFNADSNCETVFTSALSDQDGERSSVFPPGRSVARCRIPPMLLVPGSYHVLVAINNPAGPQFDLVDRALALEVSGVGSLTRIDRRLGAIAPLLQWECTRN